MLAPHSKSEFYKLWSGGHLGNRVRTFESRDALSHSDYRGNVSIRSTTRIGPCVPSIPFDLVDSTLTNHGFDTNAVFFSEAPPDAKLVLQGEAMLTPHGVALYYSRAKCPMRPALACGGTNVSGLTAVNLLKQSANPKSYDMLQSLLEVYPDAVVEFGCYSCNLGIFDGHNTIIWEVRGY